MGATENDIKSFWNSHPCGDSNVEADFAADYERFFSAYDQYRYRIEGHILECLGRIDWRNKAVLEIGLGQGADSEQMIRRGARWSGLDLTREAVMRTRTRLQLRSLPFGEIKDGSILDPPYAPKTFDIVFSHGVLHHVPDIRRASSQISRLLKPTGELIVMLYARWSWHYLVSMAIYSRAVQAAAYLAGRRSGDVLGRGYAELIDEIGLSYFRMKAFTHRNCDGPGCPEARVYSLREVRRDFPDFDVVRAYKRFMPPAPWLFGRKPPGERLLGWNLWVHLRPRAS